MSVSVEVVKQSDVVMHLHYKGAPTPRGPPSHTDTMAEPESIALEDLHPQGRCGSSAGSLAAVTVQPVVDTELSSRRESVAAAGSESAPQGASVENANENGKLPAQAHLMYATALMMMFLAGWNDGTTGPLLPRIQVVYNVSGSTRVFEWMTLTVRCCWCECR